MPRRARLTLPNIPQHIITRGNNRQPCFFADEDYRFFLEWLETYARQTGCQIHAWVLMTNHVHLLLSASTESGTGALMKALGQRYVQYVNRTYRRSGTLWEGRYRSCLAQDHRNCGLSPIYEKEPVALAEKVSEWVGQGGIAALMPPVKF
jgi:putative transposase